MANKRTLHSLKLLIFLFHATNTIILSFLPLYLRHKGLNGTEIGWVLATGPFASIISQPFWGYLSDKYKTVKTMLFISVIFMLLTSIVFFQMNGLITILIIGAFFYFFSSPVGGLSDSLAQRRANQLQVSFGSIRMWGSIGFGFSSLVVGEFLTRIGVQYMLWPYLLFGVLLLIVVFTIKDVESDHQPVSFKDVQHLFTNKSYVLFLFIMLFITITHRANDSYIGIYIAELGGKENLVGLAWFVGVMSEALIFALATLWFRKFHPILFIIMAGFLYTFRWFTYGMIEQPYLVIFFQVLHGLTFGIFYVASFDFITKIIPKYLQATGHLIFYSVLFGVSGIIGSLIGGTIIEQFSSHILYKGMGVLSFIGTILFISYYIIFRKRHAKSC